MWVSIRAAHILTGIPRRTLYYWAERGEIGVLEPTNFLIWHLRVRLEDVEAKAEDKRRRRRDA